MQVEFDCHKFIYRGFINPCVEDNESKCRQGWERNAIDQAKLPALESGPAKHCKPNQKPANTRKLCF